MGSDGRTFDPLLAAGQPRLLRAINERTVLELLRRHGAMSRTEIARQSGLSKPTVSLALTRLVDAGLAHQIGRRQRRQGTAAPSSTSSIPDPAGWSASTSAGAGCGPQWPTSPAASRSGATSARERRSSRALVAQIGEIAHRWPPTPASTGTTSPPPRSAAPACSVPSSGLLEQARQPARLGRARRGRRHQRAARHRGELRERRQSCGARRARGRSGPRRPGLRPALGRHGRRPRHRHRRRALPRLTEAPPARSPTCPSARATRTTPRPGAAASSRRRPAASGIVAHARALRHAAAAHAPRPSSRRRAAATTSPARSSPPRRAAWRWPSPSWRPSSTPSSSSSAAASAATTATCCSSPSARAARDQPVPATPGRLRAGRRGRARRRGRDRARHRPGAPLQPPDDRDRMSARSCRTNATTSHPLPRRPPCAADGAPPLRKSSACIRSEEGSP